MPPKISFSGRAEIEKIFRLNFQCLCNLSDTLDGGCVYTSLNKADKFNRVASRFRELFLREIAGFS